ncbi:MAG: glycosyltransferase [Runella slithyformis]|nr:MAG: glycosyltransferase [Runella slithyformis]TAF02640.1 MAG: glycosyltransferase [Runella slithyformis]TAF25473.1 MAG: glycosyltransferase [Runella slithyformis]TAF43794.1 MAG: glycosyltransferase [Runella slithyformis]TAF78522.1 MAG: glycosyltransferase [Runella slithyformis]
MAHHVIVIPQYNDWEALNLLIDKLNLDVAASTLAATSLIIVDDCSSQDAPSLTKFNGKSVQIIRLWRNMGHQRAIAIGLSYVADQYPCDKVIVMDADGEDAPHDINALVLASQNNPNDIVFAQRTKRQESVLFQFFYGIYKLVFRQLTGKVIAFGNFSIIPQRRLQSIVRVSEIWNNFPGGVIKSRLPYQSVPIERAKRLAGQSKMNFVSLVLHGLSTISVLIDVAAVRILILSIGMSVAALLVIFLVLFLKWVNNASPGWASTLSSALLIVVLQSFLISLFLVFMVLQYRTQQQFIPMLQYKDFVEKVETIQ